MSNQLKIARIQGTLDNLTKKWWLYLLLLLLLFIPAYSSEGYDPRRSVDLVGQVLSRPLINSFPLLMPMAKIVPLALFIALLAYRNRMKRAFDVYVAALYLALALFQTTALTPTFGFVVISGNLVLMLLVALSWVWEVVAERNSFDTPVHVSWRWWVVPVAFLALLQPVDTTAMSPDFTPLRLITNEAGLTFCMMTPVVLATLTLYYPGVNLATLRISSFVGMLFGALNMIIWFGLQPWGWWMGVLHIPLVLISVFAFVLAHAQGESHLPRAIPVQPRP